MLQPQYSTNMFMDVTISLLLVQHCWTILSDVKEIKKCNDYLNSEKNAGPATKLGATIYKFAVVIITNFVFFLLTGYIVCATQSSAKGNRNSGHRTQKERVEKARDGPRSIFLRREKKKGKTRYVDDFSTSSNWPPAKERRKLVPSYERCCRTCMHSNPPDPKTRMSTPEHSPWPWGSILIFESAISSGSLSSNNRAFRNGILVWFRASLPVLDTFTIWDFRHLVWRIGYFSVGGDEKTCILCLSEVEVKMVLSGEKSFLTK